jgi:hypothetical protein
MEDRYFKSSSLYFHPKKVMRIGLVLLGFCVAVISPLLFLHCIESESYTFIPLKGSEKKEPLEFPISLGMKEDLPVLPVPRIQEELLFSFDPPRPEETDDRECLMIRVRKGSEYKKVRLPCRLDLEFSGDRLKFSDRKSLLWLDLSRTSQGQIQAKWFVELPSEQVESSGGFICKVEESPILGVAELQRRTAFKKLAEAKWLGKDLLQKDKEEERIEIDPNCYLDLDRHHWLVYQDEKWKISSSPLKGTVIARIENSSSGGLVLEGWDSEGHVRICLPASLHAPAKLKGEELFGSLRIRSERQISCLLEKQCMVLKAGDWVLKNSGRWKILRKKEERDAFLHGKLVGDLFIFDQIAQKQGQKIMQGRLYNSSRTQVVQLEVTAQSSRAAKEKRTIKGSKG